MNKTLRGFICITIDGQRTETATFVSVEPDEWDNKAGRLKGRSEKSKIINSYLVYYKVNYMIATQNCCVKMLPSLPRCYAINSMVKMNVPEITIVITHCTFLVFMIPGFF